MFRLFRSTPADLLTSRLYSETTFYSTFTRDLKNARNKVVIESPYMTTRRATQLLPILRKLVRHGVKVTINTRYPGHHDELLRIQAWMVTKSFKQIGVKVNFFNDYHHRKIAVIDNRILYEGSLNILSQSHSREIMRRIESEELTKQMVRFLGLNRYHW